MDVHRLSLLACAAFLAVSCGNQAPSEDPYAGLPFDMPRVELPAIPSRTVVLTDFGAVGDGVTLNTEAFAKAIGQLSGLGGGTLVVPAGIWFTGPIGLESHIELNLDKDAVIVFSTDQDLYPIIDTNFEGLDVRRCLSPLHAEGATDIAITGQGMIDVRKGIYGVVNISKNSFYDGGRDFVRIDKSIASSIAITNNTFAACSVDAGNGLLWIRSLADDPSKYVVAKNLFLNIGGSSLLAKTGATVPVMSDNWFYNVAEGFFGGAISQEVATGNNGGVLAEDPCAGSAEFNLKLVNESLKKADVGDPRWNSYSPAYTAKKKQ